MQLDQSQDYRCWDNVESITLVSRRTGGDMLDSVSNVRRHMVSVKEAAASGGVYSSGDVMFIVPRAMLPASIGEPKMADLVIDDGDIRYTVLSVDNRRRDRKAVQTYKLQTRDIRIAFDLRDIITIETPVTVLDITGAEKWTNWEPKYANLPARVQKVSEGIQEERAILGFEGTFAVYVDREVIVTNRDRIKWTQGTETKYLDVMGYRSAERIDELPVIDASEKV